jgi:uncharacterized protein YciI
MSTPTRVAAAATLLSLLWCASPAAGAQDPQAPPPNMAAYYVGLLKRGPQRSTGDKAADTALQTRHIASLERRWREGTLVGAGPITEEGDLRGILIITAGDLDRARAIAADDPAVLAGRLAVDVHPWWGPRDIGAGYAAATRADPAARPAMRTYQLAFLRRGPKWTAEASPAVKAVQEGHMAHIREMGASGKLVAAGPFLDDGALAGIFVFDAGAEEARALADRDPAVQAGRLVLDFHGWMVAEGVLPSGR